MNRILRGAVVLAASALFAGCNTEPEATQGGDPTDIVINPAAIFVDRGDSNAVLIRLVDQQGTSLNTEVSITNVTPGLSISIDSLFRPVFDPATGELVADTRNTELRIFVRGVGLEAGSFTVNAGGLTEEVPVTVTPTEITPGLSNATPGSAEVVTLTAEPGLTFTPNSQLVDATGSLIAYTVGVAPDGSSMNVVFIPGAASSFTITNVIPAYAPTLNVNIPSTVEVTATATVGTGLTGTDALATAPVLSPLNGDNGSGVIDVGVFTGDYFGFPANYYRIDVTETSNTDVVMTWDGGEDLGLYYVDAEGNDLGIIADDHGSGAAASPEEHAEFELEAGTYYLVVVQFPGATPDPAFFRLSILPHEE